MNANNMKKSLIIILLFLSNLANSQSLEIRHIDSVLAKYSSESVLNSDFNNFFSENKQSYDQSTKIRYKKGIMKSANNLAMVYFTQQDNISVLKYTNESYVLANEVKDTNIIISNLLQLANVYWSTNDVNKSKKYYENALNLSLKNKNYNYAADAVYGYGLIDFMNNSDSSALKMFHKSLYYYSLGNNIDPTKEIGTYIQIGVLHFYKFKNIDSAQYYYEKANTMAINSKDNMYIGVSSMLLSDIASSKKDLKLAKNILNIAIDKIKKFNDYSRLNQIYSRISFIDAKRNDFKNAYANLLEAYNLKDSVLSQDKTKEITTLKLNSEFEKEKEVLALKKQQEQEILNNKIDSEKRVKNYLYATAFLLLIVALIIFRSYRVTTKSNIVINRQKEKIEHQHKEMTDSITYAKGIQEAIMPAIKDKNIFVLYQPKDIVSGDFYWSFVKSSNAFGHEYKFYAVADCTGHGVPGALMSMLCSQLLNEAVEIHNKPADIINYVKTALDNKMKAMGRNDGMEISLVCLYKNHVYFAGIKRPLYVVLNNELETIKPIDNENVIIEIKEGMNVYMTTDGYADQFGTCNKKFTSKLMKHEMVINSKYSTTEQLEKFKHTINYWKGDTEQTDDILLMGFKF
jgi:serine phosphatase RsbU (regulator of sigma subunit)